MATDMKDGIRAARETVLAVEASDRAGIVVRGKDRTSWLNGLVTCDVGKLAPGEGAYGLILEKKGRIQTDFYALPSAANDVLVLAVPRSLKDAVLETLDHHLIMEDVEIEPTNLTCWQLTGPGSSAFVEALAAPFGGRITRIGGAFVATPAEEAEAFRTRLTAALVAAGGALADEATWEAVRIEFGVPRFGVEVDGTHYPQEASLEKLAVSFDKGCYLGQEVVYMLENRGHAKQKLVMLDIDGEEAPAKGAVVATVEGAVVGDVRSAALAPSTGKPVAIAMIKWAQTKPGTELRIAERAARVRASDRA